jgi:hypothetical protein
MYLGNLAMMGVSQVLGILANGQGPVSISFPFAICASILSVLLLQWRLGMVFPSKCVRVGTYTLSAAIVILPSVGPAEAVNLNVVDLLLKPLSLIFIGLCVVGMFVGICAIRSGWVTDNSVVLWTFAFVGGAGTVLNVSITKLIQLPDVALAIRIGLGAIYVLLAGVTLGVQAIANGKLSDPSTYIPVSCGVNLWLNFLAGLCIWGEWNRMTKPVSYFFVFVLVCLGTYGLSSFDLIPHSTKEDMIKEKDEDVEPRELSHFQRSSTRRRTASKTMKGNISAPDRLGTASMLQTLQTKAIASFTLPSHLDYAQNPLWTTGVDLWNAWSEHPADADDTKFILKKYLRLAVSRSLIDANGLTDLCLQLLEEQPESREFYTPALERWLLNSVESFEECREEAMSSSDSDSCDDSGLAVDPLSPVPE